MKKRSRNWFSALLAVLLLFPASGLPAFADDGAYPPSPDGVDFHSLVISGENGMSHHLFTLEFDPIRGDILPMAFSARNGYGATVYDSAKKAEELGYDVKAAVNASFFSMSYPHTSSNPYGGVNISDGRIMQGDNDFSPQWELVFHSDGRTSVQYSKIEYTVVAGDGSWHAPLAHVNICPTTSAETDSGIYYFDSFCGETSDAKAPGVEVLFEKLDGTELTVGGTLCGKVIEVRDITSAGGEIGEDQFVLYASDVCSQRDLFRSLSAGDVVAVRAEETIEESAEAMETCNSALVIYGYTIVKDRQNVTDYDDLGWDFNTARAQRTCIGVKSDGSLLIVASEGRKPENYPGMTVYELADYMISQDCVTAINLDGGGSTQVTLENASGGLECVFDTESRPVANSLLLVARPEPDAEDRSELVSLLAQATADAANQNFGGDAGLLELAIEDAKTVRDSRTSMPGDYRRAIQRLYEATDATRTLDSALLKVGSLDVRQYNEYALRSIRKSYHEALNVRNDADSTPSDRFLAASNLQFLLGRTGSFSAQNQTFDPLQSAIRLTGFNKFICTDDASLYTPGTSILGKNLSYTQMLLFRRAEPGGSYRLVLTARGGEEGGDPATVATLQFDTVPEDCLLLAVHGDDGEGRINRSNAEAASLGQTLFLCGVDVETQTFDVCSCCIIADSGKNLIPDAPNARPKGDVSGDGKVDSADYLLLKRYVLGTFRLEGEALDAADIDGDGIVGAYDYLLLKRYCLGTYRIGGEGVY